MKKDKVVATYFSAMRFLEAALLEKTLRRDIIYSRVEAQLGISEITGFLHEF